MENEKTAGSSGRNKLDLSEYIYRYLKCLRYFWPWVLILALLFGAGYAVKEYMDFTPYYTSQAKFIVSSGYTADDLYSSRSYYDNSATEQLAQSFPGILNTDVMRDLLMARLDKSYINGTITATAVADTNLFKLSVRSRSAQDAYDILCAVIDCYPQVASYMVTEPQIVIKDAPTQPSAPSNSYNWKSPALRGALIGAAVGLLLCAVVMLLRRTVHSADELKKLINLPVLGSLPRVNVKKRRSDSNKSVFLLRDPDFDESVRGMRVKVSKRMEDFQRKIILVTGTVAGEGKTTVARRLAMSLVDAGSSVVLVDGDLRKQTFGFLYGLENAKKGLGDYLRGEVEKPEDCLLSLPESELKIVTGESYASEEYSLDDKKLRRFFDTLAAKFDYVIVDSSPCGVVADAGILCHYATGVLYVVRQDYAKQTQILDGIGRILNKNANIIGLVLNGAEGSSHRYGYGYGYGYGSYKYGYYGGYHYSYGKYGNNYSHYDSKYGKYSKYSKYGSHGSSHSSHGSSHGSKSK